MSASIPSFANRSDFYGTLLPGYLIVLLYVFLYQPGILTGATDVSLDILWTVVFLVAGPTVGLAVTHAHRMGYYFLWATFSRNSATKDGARAWRDQKIIPESKKKKASVEDLTAYGLDYRYHLLREKANSDQLAEVDLAESKYNFDASASLGLLGMGIAQLFVRTVSSYWVVLLLLGGLVFVMGAYYQLQ